MIKYIYIFVWFVLSFNESYVIEWIKSKRTLLTTEIFTHIYPKNSGLL
jgi:hypothetical protein